MPYHNKSLTNSPILIRLLDLHDGRIRPRNTEEQTQRDQRDVEYVCGLLEKRAAGVGAVVVEPEVAGQGDGEGREGKGADEGEEVVEDRDGFGEYECLRVEGELSV